MLPVALRPKTAAAPCAACETSCLTSEKVTAGCKNTINSQSPLHVFDFPLGTAEHKAFRGTLAHQQHIRAHIRNGGAVNADEVIAVAEALLVGFRPFAHNRLHRPEGVALLGRNKMEASSPVRHGDFRVPVVGQEVKTLLRRVDNQ